MMRKARWFGIVMVCLAVAMAATGCKSRRARRGVGVDGIGGVTGTDIYGQPLSDRPGGAEYAGQFMPVYFDYDSSQINTSERSKIETVADHMRSNRGINLIIEGHCDERGSREYNMALGERRALAARAYLIGLGIDGSRIQTKSYGEERPAAMGHEESSWSQNRRGEFVLSY
ncbi:MAG: peptidoglycan-associated lipoprotein Pal [Kiritimatiellae bacterium]|nr:peptidoglycan-associated lipoprotein Pal [Kiritimatiellia bacterium]